MSHYIAQQPEIVMCTLSRKATVGQGRRRGKLQHMGGLHSMRAALVLGSTTLLCASSSAALALFAGGVAWHRASVAPADRRPALRSTCVQPAKLKNQAPARGKGPAAPAKALGRCIFATRGFIVA